VQQVVVLWVKATPVRQLWGQFNEQFDKQFDEQF